MILFITGEPYTYNLNGAAALSSSHLRFLVQKFPDHSLKIIFLNESNDFWIDNADFETKNLKIEHSNLSNLSFLPLKCNFLRLFFLSDKKKLINSLFKIHFHPESEINSFKNEFEEFDKLSYIWCEHLTIVIFLYSIFSEKSILKKIVYSHHDFLYKILWNRAKSPKHYIRSLLVRKLELSLIKDINFFISGSISELREINKIAPKLKFSEFLPCFFPSAGLNKIRPSEGLVTIYHLGTSAATANKIGLRFFFEKVFPAIEHLPFVLEFLGSIKDYVTQEFPHLKKHPKIVFHGFVPDLFQIIKPGMIHVIPYSGHTGTRTRIPALVQFQPCILGFENMKDSYPFLKSGKNVMIARDEREFTELLIELIYNDRLRNKISENIEADLIKFKDDIFNQFNIY